jgi:hypothetical protein
MPVAREQPIKSSQLIAEKLLHFVSFQGLRQSHMSHRKNEPPPLDNAISDQTGQFDLRFVLWRHFCKQNNIPVETLPSQLNDSQKELWEELKASRLRGQ